MYDKTKNFFNLDKFRLVVLNENTVVFDELILS